MAESENIKRNTLKIAAVQLKAEPNSPQKNLESGLCAVRRAHEMGADIVLFPEMWSHAYAAPFETAFDNPFDPNFKAERDNWLDSALSEDSEYVNKFRAIAKELKIGIVITFMKKTQSNPENAAYLIGRDGSILIRYSKVHTCDFSLEALFNPGEEFFVSEFDGVKLGIMICYDREFPESARVLMLKGAEIILVPNACDMNPARINQLNARAFENMTGVVMANYPDKGWGHSCAFSPIVFDENGWCDNLMFECSDISEEISIAEFDIDKIRAYREYESWGNSYRKPLAYSALTDREVKSPFIRHDARNR